MQSYKIKHLHFVKANLPHQHRNCTVRQTFTFLLDTGATRSLVPLSFLLDNEIRSMVPIDKLLHSCCKREIDVANGNKLVCYEISLKDVEVLGFTIKNFNCLVADNIPDKYAILGCDFIDSCTYYHTAGCNWDFRSFDKNRYADIWKDISAGDIKRIADVVHTALSEQDLTSISDF